MEHDTHQNKVLALGIALLVATVIIVFSMHDADANPDSGRTLRVRDAPSSEPSRLASSAENDVMSPRTDGKRAPLPDRR